MTKLPLKNHYLLNAKINNDGNRSERSMKIESDIVPDFALSFLEDLLKLGRKESTVTRYYRDLKLFFMAPRTKER